MARTLYPTQDAGPTAWSAAAWSLADDNAKDEAKPEAGDTVIFTANSGEIALDEDTASLAEFTLGGGEIDGYDGTIWVLYCAGDVTRTGGTADALTIEMTGTADLDWATTSQALLWLVVTGTVTITSAYAGMKRLDGAGTIGGNYVYFHDPTNNFWTFTGTYNCTQVYIDDQSGQSSPGGAIKLVNKTLRIRRAPDGILANADIDIGTGLLNIEADGANVVLDMDIHNLTCGDLRVGNDTHNATLDLGTGSHRISGTFGRGPGWSSGTCSVEFATSSIDLTGGTFDGTGLVCTAPAPGSGHPEIHNGTVQDVTFPLDDQPLDCTDQVADGGGNTNCVFSGANGFHRLIGSNIIGSGTVAPLLTIGFVTDTHFSNNVDAGNRYYSEAPDKCQDAVDQFVADGVDLIVHIGDAMDDEADSVGSPSDMDDCVAMLNGNSGSIPVLWVIGNHDCQDGSYDKTDWIADTGQAATYSYVDLKNIVRVFSLDCCFSSVTVSFPTPYTPNAAYISTAQLTSLAADLAAADALGMFSVLCLHYGAGIFADGQRDVQNFADLQTVFEAYKTIAVFSGHMHEPTVSHALGTNVDGANINHYGIEANVDGQRANGKAAHVIATVRPGGIVSTQGFLGG